MSLIRQIQDDAVSSAIDLATVLRRCKVLAARLKSPALEKWIQWECDGYPKDVALPSYRVIRMRLLGHFSGPFGTGLRNAEIPSYCLPEEIRKHCTIHHTRVSIHSIQETAEAGKKDGALQVPISSDLLQFFAERVYDGMVCLSAFGVINSTALGEILNNVRNRVLDFALQIEKIDPQAGESALSSELLTDGRVNQVFNTTVYGGAATVVGTATDSIVSTNNINKGDFLGLQRSLEFVGVSFDDIESLRQALKDEPESDPRNGFGKKVTFWIGSMIGKAASGAWKVGTDVAAKVLSSYICAYYGWPSK